MAQMSEVSELLLYEPLFLQEYVIFHAMFTTYSEIVFVVYFCFASHDHTFLHSGLVNIACTNTTAGDEELSPK